MHILILTAKLGGGHRTNAGIIRDLAFSNGHTAKVIDITDLLPKIGSRTFIEWFYYLTAVKYSFLWPAVIRVGSWIPGRWLVRMAAVPLQRQLREVIARERPEAIFSTYGPLAAIVESLRLEPTLALTSVVCDAFSNIFYWFYGQTDTILVMSPKVYDYAVSMGISLNRLQLIEPLVGAKFHTTLTSVACAELRQSWSLMHRQSVLVLAGGEGLPGARHIVNSLINDVTAVNIIVVCGRDQSLQLDLVAVQRLQPDIPLYIYGFTEQVYELINLADVVVSKAGPATILETLALQKQLVITSYYPQEKGNLDFVLQNEYGFYEPDPAALPPLIRLILNGKVRASKTWFSKAEVYDLFATLPS